jgi:DNA excision repair protein ERCC-3
MGNVAVDSPDADVLIQVSSQQGLRRQEEAQRSGREGCPGKTGARMQFYTLVSLRTCEEDFARHRQLFLTGQGYTVRIAKG